MSSVTNFGGYIKLIALSIHSFETQIIYERNTNLQKDVSDFKEKYAHQDNVIPLVFDMGGSGVHIMRGE